MEKTTISFINAYLEMRAKQNEYFAQRKLEGTRFGSKKARQLLAESKKLEKDLDILADILLVQSKIKHNESSGNGFNGLMQKAIKEGKIKPLSSPLDGGSNVELQETDTECKTWCGLNYCDENGCNERKRHYVPTLDVQCNPS